MPSLACTKRTWSHTTDDPWYLEWVNKVILTPEDYPTWKMVSGDLYVYRTDAEVSEDLGDDDAWQAVLRECHDEAVAGHLQGEHQGCGSWIWLKLQEVLLHHK